jgi:crotonobetainyl-CoA:carnitine CoA-transferase CaiB-like acyl-CoA transferase
VFLENMNPTKLERLGIDAASLLARNPRLVYCAMSGFGLDGPASPLPGYDLVAQARSGLMSVTGARGGTPQRVSTALSDVVTGMTAALAINAALVRQQRDGQGEVIDVSLLDSDLALMAPRIAAFWAGEPEPAPSGGTDSVLSVYQPFETQDRTIVVAVGNDAMWRRFCDVLGLEDLGAEPGLSDNAGRRRERERITATVGACLRTRPAEDWLRALAAAGVPAASVQSLSEVVEDEQVLARGSLMPVPGSGNRLVSVRAPFRLRSQPAPRNDPFPGLGADSLTILKELGYPQEDVDALLTRGVVGAPRDDMTEGTR